MTSSQQPPRDDSADTPAQAPLSLAELTRAAVAIIVSTGGVISDRGRDRVTGVAQINEIDALDHAAVFYVEAGNDADLEHYAALISLSAATASSRPS